MKIASIAFVFLAATLSGANAQNLLKNSSFETPVVAEGTFFNGFAPGHNIGAWTVVGSASNLGGVTLVSGAYQTDGITFNAHSGKQYLNLDWGYTAGVEQTVTTTTGANYILTFWLGSAYPTNGFADLSMVDVYINGYRTASMIQIGKVGSTKQIWKQYSVTLTASSNQTTITLLNGTQFAVNDAIDDVKLVPAQ